MLTMKNQTLFRGPFLLLWLAQISSQLAFNMLNFILIILVFEKTLSNTAVSGLIVSFTIPALLFGLLAGAYVDRRNKKSVLLITNISRAVLAVLFYLTKDTLATIYLLSFLTSVSTQFFVPAEAASIPRVVGKARLLRANSLFAITLYGSVLLGYILAGPLIKILGIENSFLVGALFYFLASLFVSLLPSMGREKDMAVGDFLGNSTLERAVTRIREAYELMRQVKNILVAILFLTLSQGLIIILATILPGYATTVLEVESSDISLIILIPAALGVISGAFILTRLGARVKQQLLINSGIILSGIILIILSYLSVFVQDPALRIPLVMANLFILGVVNAFIVVISNATLQSTDEHLIGRAYGVVVAASAGLALFPVILAGGLADIFGVRVVLVSIGLLMLFLGVGKSYKDYVS